MASEREHYAWDIRQRLGRWNDGALPVMQCIDRLVARADLAEQREAELLEKSKAIISDLLAGALSGADQSVRYKGHVRWGLVEKRMHAEIEALAKHKAEGREGS